LDQRHDERGDDRPDRRKQLTELAADHLQQPVLEPSEVVTLDRCPDADLLDDVRAVRQWRLLHHVVRVDGRAVRPQARIGAVGGDQPFAGHRPRDRIARRPQGRQGHAGRGSAIGDRRRPLVEPAEVDRGPDRTASGGFDVGWVGDDLE
jgi:hypothetical protein